jgi:methyl-accepting chemotaxis protein
METILDAYVDDKIGGLHQLLVKNLLDQETSFVTDYQKIAARSSKALKLAETGYIFTLAANGAFVFCSKEIDPQFIESVWGKHAIDIAKGTATELTGHLHTPGFGSIYAARYFKPWEWVVFYATSDDELHRSLNSIRNATILIAVICAAASWLFLFLVIRKILIRPVRELQTAASTIAEGKAVTDIQVHSRDELGDLTRNMEFMAQAIQAHRAEQMVWQEKLEKKVKEQTEHLTTEIEERKRAEAEKENLIAELQEALSKVKTLSGLLPICSSCKNIRDDSGYWKQIESYIGDHSEAEFSHSICPECAKKLYPDLEIYKE